MHFTLALSATPDWDVMRNIIIVFVALPLLIFASEIKGFRYKKRGAQVDNGRGPLALRTQVSGNRVSFACESVVLQGILFDNAEGEWAREHLPAHIDAYKLSVPGHSRMEFFRGYFGDGDDVEAVRRMISLEDVREGDITMAIERTRSSREKQYSVAITLWGRKPHLVRENCVRIGRLSYESLMSIRGVEDRQYKLEVSRLADALEHRSARS